ncbi:MAG: phosphatidate cytidylyltransferase [Dermatophilus congolensis]|nr:phosphatidate cytidylyltransferase [Dermatophilus congolensis]
MSAPPAEKKRKAGRNLPAAIGVGVLMGLVALGCIFVAPWGWLLLVTPAAVIAVTELRRGFVEGGHSVPIVPVVLAAAVMCPAAYFGGPAALVVTFGLSVLAVVVWRALSGAPRTAIRDMGSGVFMLAYAPFLAGFSALLLAQPDGRYRVIAFVLITVFSDIGGYAAGVTMGKHPMSPSVSPNKSWEGFAGSVVTCAVVGSISVMLMLDAAWWVGAVTGMLLAALATLGDLTESMLKRDLGIKDFGTMLPGHGGLMDRMDSLLVCAPASWIAFTLLLGA